jgi:nucleoside triphosphate pyrophosphatase
MQLVLASASPRRAELLRTAGFSFDVRPADVDETPRLAEPPAAYALRVARDKALAAAGRMDAADVWILAADTVVVADGHILGKPTDHADARRMLSMLSGVVHEVLTAVVVRHDEVETSEVVSTRVRFAALGPAEIDWYVGSGEPDGKAGAYAIQGLGSRFVDRIEGSWSNVVGLPVATVYRMLGGGACYAHVNPAGRETYEC